MGMTRTKQFIRSRLWWPGLDADVVFKIPYRRARAWPSGFRPSARASKGILHTNADVEEMVKRCSVCLSVNPEGGKKLELLRITPFPDRHFSIVHIDLFGPLTSGETILGIIDEYSKLPPELYVLKGGVCTQDVDGALDKLFARFCYVDQVVSDNGPQFRSWKFDNYMQAKGIKHHLVTPYYPEANSSIERFFRNLKKFVKVCSFQGVELKSELNALLFNFLANDVRGEGVRSSNLSAFVDEQWGVLREEYGVWDSRSNAYNKRYILHLGKSIRLLAKTVRESVH